MGFALSQHKSETFNAQSFTTCGFHQLTPNQSPDKHPSRSTRKMRFIFNRRHVSLTNLFGGVQVEFEKPAMTLEALMKYGRLLVEEQENVKRVQLADAYLSGAELAGSSGSSMPEEILAK